MILTLALTPFVLALFVTLVLRATVRNGTAWAIGVGVVLAVGLFVCRALLHVPLRGWLQQLRRV